jgi:hypothetical protein
MIKVNPGRLEERYDNMRASVWAEGVTKQINLTGVTHK